MSAGKRYKLELDPKFKNGAVLIIIREAANVAAELLTDQLTGIESDADAIRIDLLCTWQGRVWLEQFVLVIIWNAWASVADNDR